MKFEKVSFSSLCTEVWRSGHKVKIDQHLTVAKCFANLGVVYITAKNVCPTALKYKICHGYMYITFATLLHCW